MTILYDHTFVPWAVEREKIRERRETGEPGPWTIDPILQKYRFCNVCREDDKTTRWIKKHVRDPLADAMPIILLQSVALARLTNRLSTLRALWDAGCFSPLGIDWGLVKKTVESLPPPVFTSAYIIRSETGMAKIESVSHICQSLRWKGATTIQGAVEDLQSFWGMGSFIAGQIAADLIHTPLLIGAKDRLTWAPMGPGAIRGMNRTLGRNPGSTLTKMTYVDTGLLQRELLIKANPSFQRLTLADVASNVNCETDKYLRAKEPGVKGLRKFTPAREE